MFPKFFEEPGFTAREFGHVFEEVESSTLFRSVSVSVLLKDGAGHAVMLKNSSKHQTSRASSNDGNSREGHCCNIEILHGRSPSGPISIDEL